jgi:hypothetical protein
VLIWLGRHRAAIEARCAKMGRPVLQTPQKVGDIALGSKDRESTEQNLQRLASLPQAPPLPEQVGIGAPLCNVCPASHSHRLRTPSPADSACRPVCSPGRSWQLWKPQ